MKRFPVEILCVIAALAALIILGPRACTDSESALRVLRAQGYTKVEITGWRPFAKGKDDFYSTGFRAVAPSGEVVTGTVTSGFWFKSSTVRLD